MSRTRIQLYDITDVNIVQPVAGDVISFDGTDWGNAPTPAPDRIVSDNSVLVISDDNINPSTLSLSLNGTSVMVADSDKMVFAGTTTSWISYAF